MVTPGRVLDVLMDCLGALDVGSGESLSDGDGLVTEGPACDVDRLGYGLEISGVVPRASIELY